MSSDNFGNNHDNVNCHNTIREVKGGHEPCVFLVNSCKKILGWLF